MYAAGIATEVVKVPVRRRHACCSTRMCSAPLGVLSGMMRGLALLRRSLEFGRCAGCRAAAAGRCDALVRMWRWYCWGARAMAGSPCVCVRLWVVTHGNAGGSAKQAKGFAERVLGPFAGRMLWLAQRASRRVISPSASPAVDEQRTWMADSAGKRH